MDFWESWSIGAPVRCKMVALELIWITVFFPTFHKINIGGGYEWGRQIERICYAKSQNSNLLRALSRQLKKSMTKTLGLQAFEPSLRVYFSLKVKKRLKNVENLTKSRLKEPGKWSPWQGFSQHCRFNYTAAKRAPSSSISAKELILHVKCTSWQSSTPRCIYFTSVSSRFLNQISFPCCLSWS